MEQRDRSLAQAYERMSAYLRGLSAALPRRPSALLVVSAHWEEPVVTVMAAERPPMLYDYRGFPSETYEVQWPAPGAPATAARVRELLDGAGIASAQDDRRGFDHGTFVPLALAYPDADVPTLQLSLEAGLDPEKHLAVGRALAPLRDEGVFILGSGMSYHNMRGFFGQVQTAHEDSIAFDEWLAESCALDSAARAGRLAAWTDAPSGRACHPREEHLLPLMVVAGAADDDAATLPYRDEIMGTRVSAVHFG